jgi:hypothetical protein
VKPRRPPSTLPLRSARARRAPRDRKGSLPHPRPRSTVARRDQTSLPLARYGRGRSFPGGSDEGRSAQLRFLGTLPHSRWSTGLSHASPDGPRHLESCGWASFGTADPSGHPGSPPCGLGPGKTNGRRDDAPRQAVLLNRPSARARAPPALSSRLLGSPPPATGPCVQGTNPFDETLPPQSATCGEGRPSPHGLPPPPRPPLPKDAGRSAIRPTARGWN